MTLPIITVRQVAGTHAGSAEKGALTTTAGRVGTGAFAAKYVFSGADISIQMILRADRSFLDLLDQEFIEAYALDMEDKALDALIAGYTDSGSVAHQMTNGGSLDPEDPAVRLQADAPAVAGRDIVLAGTLFPAPRYADAFTYYTIAS